MKQLQHRIVFLTSVFVTSILLVHGNLDYLDLFTINSITFLSLLLINEKSLKKDIQLRLESINSAYYELMSKFDSNESEFIKLNTKYLLLKKEYELMNETIFNKSEPVVKTKRTKKQ